MFENILGKVFTAMIYFNYITRLQFQSKLNTILIHSKESYVANTLSIKCEKIRQLNKKKKNKQDERLENHVRTYGFPKIPRS